MNQGRILEKNALLEIPQNHPFFFKKLPNYPLFIGGHPVAFQGTIL